MGFGTSAASRGRRDGFPHEMVLAGEVGEPVVILVPLMVVMMVVTTVVVSSATVSSAVSATVSAFWFLTRSHGRKTGVV